jgi:peptidoglycan/xylan/chitin deacetylase (PgdA/CDA1 family)
MGGDRESRWLGARARRSLGRAVRRDRPIPILLYHSISDAPDPWIRRFAVTPRTFGRHLDLVAASGATTLTVSAFADALARGPAALPERPVLITFDDGFADFRDAALPALLARDLAATLYATTGFLGRRGPGGARMLDWRDLAEMAWGHGAVEIGGHTDSHPQLDIAGPARAREEITRCRAQLEDVLGTAPRSFAYPHGYSTAAVRAMVRAAGFDTACAVRNAFSSAADDRLALARLTVRVDTPDGRIEAWLRGQGAPVARRQQAVRTRAGRLARRVRARTRAW